MDANPHAHEAENERPPPRFATGGNATQLRRRSQFNMPRQLHRLSMQPQTESASNLIFGGSYGSPGTYDPRRPRTIHARRVRYDDCWKHTCTPAAQ